MSVEPPSSGRPTGPPSGPLSGPSQPPSGPPSQPPPSQPDDGGAEEPEPHRPWWRSTPRIVAATAAVVAAVVLAVVLTRTDGGSGGGSGEVFLQAAGETGPDPFTESTAKDSSTPPVTPPPATDSAPAGAVRGVDGGARGLYGGTRNVSSCDVEKQIEALRAQPRKNSAFAAVVGVEPSGVPAHLRSLTPVQLRMDTRVTNHGYRDGAATPYQAVLQAGTAVLVDDRGVPRVRCACGNPLTPAIAQQGTPKRTGDSWPSYRPSNVVVVAPATTVINVFVLYDPERHEWIARPRGDTGHKDRKTDGHGKPVSPSVSVSTAPSASGSPAPCVSSPACPPTSKPAPVAPSSPESSPSSEPPPSDTPSADTPSSRPGTSGSPAPDSPSAPASPETPGS
ncbi:DUF6777 domain-containing protein [Streptomyces sp. NPDC002888]|uniref:DUF6777 domain-containing protein n=1 Tax=Streptomyces sp. NPDC002888 TaxID=3364668 RepID=UPI0036C68389